MKLLYIGDNSDSLNLGCRATSIALRELASEHAELLGPVPTRMIQARWPVSDFAGDWAYGQAARLLNRNRFRALPLVGSLVGKVMDAIGTRDAITHDLEANADALIRAQSYSKDARALITWLEEADGAVVNGEGDLIFSDPARQRLLFILTICDMLLKRGKTLFYLNAMASPPPHGAPNAETLAIADSVLSRASAFSLRDPKSHTWAREHLPEAGLKATMHPDAVFTWLSRFDHLGGEHDPAAANPYLDSSSHAFPKEACSPYILVGGSSRSAWDKPRAAKAFPALVEALQEMAQGRNLKVVLQPACTGDSFLEDVAKETGAPIVPLPAPIDAHVALLANARAYISGRWHPSIMAALGGTPCVFMGSNSHKMLALQEQLGYSDPHEFSPWPEADDIAAMVEEVSRLLDEGAERREAIRASARAMSAASREMIDPLLQPSRHANT